MSQGERGDSAEYMAKKRYFDRFLTIYGRSAVIEALLNDDLHIERVHLARNVKGKDGDKIRRLCEQRGVELCERPPAEVTRISKNGRQDQGVAADICWDGYERAEDFFAKRHGTFSSLLLTV